MYAADSDEEAWEHWEELVAQFPPILTKRDEVLKLLEAARDTIDMVRDQVDVDELDQAIVIMKGGES